MTKGTIWQGKQLYRALATQLTGSSNKFHVGGNNQVENSELIIVSAEMYEKTEISLLELLQTQARPGQFHSDFLLCPAGHDPCHQVPFACPVEQAWRRVPMSGEWKRQAQKDPERVLRWCDSFYFPCVFLHTSAETSGFLSIPVCSYTRDMPTQGSQWAVLPQSLLSGRISFVSLVSPHTSSRYPQNMFSDLWGAREGPPCPGWRSVTHLLSLTLVLPLPNGFWNLHPLKHSCMDTPLRGGVGNCIKTLKLPTETWSQYYHSFYMSLIYILSLIF